MATMLPGGSAILARSLASVSYTHLDVYKRQLNATTLYRTLSPQGNPELRSLTAILKVMGVRLAVQPDVGLR